MEQDPDAVNRCWKRSRIMGEAFLEFASLVSSQWKTSQRYSCRHQGNQGLWNLLGYDKLLLRDVGGDSNAVFGPQYAYIPFHWDLLRPRNFKLTVTFDL